MLICKICNPTLEGNGYCAKHSTSGTGYFTENQDELTQWQKMTRKCGGRLLKKYEKICMEIKKGLRKLRKALCSR